MRPPRVARAVAAAGSVAAAHGVRTEPLVLRNGVNVVLHLRPAPVVARLAALTAELRPQVAQQVTREVELAEALSGAGAAVMPPSDVLPPGPHRHDGVVLGCRPRPSRAAVGRPGAVARPQRGARTAGSRMTRNRARGSCSVAGGRAADRGTTRSHRAGRRCGGSSPPWKE